MPTERRHQRNALKRLRLLTCSTCQQLADILLNDMKVFYTIYLLSRTPDQIMLTHSSRLWVQGCERACRFSSSSHLKLGLQRWQLLLNVFQLGRQVQLLALQVVDLAISSLDPVKEPPALLLHTSPPITISNANSFTGLSQRSSTLQPELNLAKPAHHVSRERSSKQMLGAGHEDTILTVMLEWKQKGTQTQRKQQK